MSEHEEKFRDVLAMALDVRDGSAHGVWGADWYMRWADAYIDLFESLAEAQKKHARLVGALEDIASGKARRVITSSLAWDGTTPPEQIVARSALRDVAE